MGLNLASVILIIDGIVFSRGAGRDRRREEGWAAEGKRETFGGVGGGERVGEASWPARRPGGCGEETGGRVEPNHWLRTRNFGVNWAPWALRSRRAGGKIRDHCRIGGALVFDRRWMSFLSEAAGDNEPSPASPILDTRAGRPCLNGFVSVYGRGLGYQFGEGRAHGRWTHEKARRRPPWTAIASESF